MTSSHPYKTLEVSDSHRARHGNESESNSPPETGQAQQVANRTPRSLSCAEQTILQTIGRCLKHWYEPWRRAYMADGREFEKVYDLMDGLLHYEEQITNSERVLPCDRTNAIAQAVARLVDYGNAVLNIDLIIRANDETLSEFDPTSMTTTELYLAHIKANNLRDKLLNDYFRKDKPASLVSGASEHLVNWMNGSTRVQHTLQVPTPSSGRSNSTCSTLERPQRRSMGSSTSINSLHDGRRTPQFGSHNPQIEVRSVSASDLSTEVDIVNFKRTIQSEAFLSLYEPNIRLSILPAILAKLDGLLSSPSTVEKLTNGFELLDCLLDSLEKLPAESRNKEVNLISIALLKPIVRKIYIDDHDNLVEFQGAHWTTCLLSIMRLMTPSDFNAYLAHFSSLVDLGAFLKDYLFIVKRIISSLSRKQSETQTSSKNTAPTYPNHWIEMNLLTCSTFLTSLTYLYQVICQYFGSNLHIWLSLIDCFIHFLMQDALMPDRCMLREQQRTLADDLRQKTTEYIRIAWNALGTDQKQQLLEDLIEPLIQACMTLPSRQRSILLPIFYDIMQCDYINYYSNPHRSFTGNDSSASTVKSTRRDLVDRRNEFTMNSNLITESGLQPDCPTRIHDESLPYLSPQEGSVDGKVLTRFAYLVIGKLNKLMMDQYKGDDQFKLELCAAISSGSSSSYPSNGIFPSGFDSSRLESVARHTANLFGEFIQICLDSRQANKLAYKHLYLLCLHKLALFFRDKVDRLDHYLSSLYKLFCLHHNSGRYIEAGYILLEHAKSIPWSNEPLSSQHRIVQRYFQTSNEHTASSTNLKIFLYNMTVEYFDRGQLWEASIPVLRELVDHYQFESYEYAKLAQVLAKMSECFSNIVDTSLRQNPEYFRVAFYGRGFPSCIRNSTVVYRGKPYEKLGDFQSTILSKYPDAKLLTSLATPDDQMLSEDTAKYLQINACTPIVDLEQKFGENLSKIDESILNYHKHNECSKFQFSRRIDPPTLHTISSQSSSSLSDSFADMWRERTTLTSDALPGMLPFSTVFLIKTSLVSPIESAIEDLKRTNDRLTCMVNRFRVDKERQVEDIRLLGQLLVGIVDAAVNGGIAKYEEAFFSLESADQKSACPNSSPSSQFVGGKQQSVMADGHSKQPSTEDLLVEVSNEEEQSRELFSAQVVRLKSLIAGQVPLLDEAIQLHGKRVADVLRPQHEHLELAYKKLKHHIMNKYSRYLPSDYNRSTLRSFRSLSGRSPNRSTRSDTRSASSTLATNTNRLTNKRLSDVNQSSYSQQPAVQRELSSCAQSSKIPYRQMSRERRSLPFIAGVLSATPAHSSAESDKRLPPDVLRSKLPIPRVRNSISASSYSRGDIEQLYVQPIVLSVPPDKSFNRRVCELPDGPSDPDGLGFNDGENSRPVSQRSKEITSNQAGEHPNTNVRRLESVTLSTQMMH